MILELTRQNILNLTNESKRKNILAAWRSWGIWHKAPEIGLSVYRLDLPDGSFFTASWYEGDDFFPGGGTHYRRFRGRDGRLGAQDAERRCRRNRQNQRSRSRPERGQSRRWRCHP